MLCWTSQIKHTYKHTFWKCNYWWCCPRSFGIFNYFGLFAFHYGHTGIGCTKVNTNDSTLDPLSPTKQKEELKKQEYSTQSPFLPCLPRRAQSGKWTSFGKRVWFTESHRVLVFSFSLITAQWKPLIMITLGPALFDNNNRLLTLSGGYKNLHYLTQFIVTTFYMYKT
jgi:hypothetical protein